MIGNLYIVATPIGNLEDISARAVRILNEVGLIAAEDTRHSRHLLQHFGIKTPLTSVHQFNEKKASQKLIEELRQGKNIALISDAGTPLVSDPGHHLLAEAIAAGIKIVPIPGACAAIAALCVSGLPTDKFLFVGFLPAKTGERQQKLVELKPLAFTLIFYEAPHRVAAMLADLEKVLGSERKAVIGRELTKTFESILRGTLQELKSHFEVHQEEVKGEFVILVEGESEKTDFDEEKAVQILKILLADLSINQAVKLASQITDISRNKLYQMALKLQAKLF